MPDQPKRKLNRQGAGRKILFRADGSQKAGFGHLVRSSVLAHAFKAKGYEPLFLSYAPDEAVRGFLSARGFECIGTPHSAGEQGADFHAEAMDNTGASVSVLDSYKVDDAYRAKLKKHGAFIVAVDDIYAHFSHADAVINHNPSANPSRYSGFAGRLLHGSQYAMVGSSFSSCRIAASAEPAILVVMGGTDALGGLGRVLGLLDKVDGNFSVKAVGGYYGQSGLPSAFTHHCEILPFTNDMPSLVSQCSAAITAGGITCMEFACAGLPFLTLLADEHQRSNAEAYAASGVAAYAGAMWEKDDAALLGSFGSFLSASDKWPTMSANGRRMIDGKGPERIVSGLEPLFR